MYKAWEHGLQQDDIVLVNRGYRDATDFLKWIDIQYKIPAFLQQGPRQLITEKANESRLVTKSRWINEARNGHMKFIFKFFDHTVPFAHIMNLWDYYLIVGALINKYHERILMYGADAQLAQLILQRVSHKKTQKINVLRTRVEVDNFLRRGEWVHLDENQAQDFPRLDLQYLCDICLGVYQVNVASGYIQDKLKREDNDVFQYDQNHVEPNLIRVRVFSRFRNAGRHQLWISFNVDNDINDSPITGYYCTCKCGSRTVRTCAHVASTLVLRICLAQTAYQVSSHSFHHVLDAANRSFPENENVEII